LPAATKHPDAAQVCGKRAKKKPNETSAAPNCCKFGCLKRRRKGEKTAAVRNFESTIDLAAFNQHKHDI
jgi:hypothetical protein